MGTAADSRAAVGSRPGGSRASADSRGNSWGEACRGYTGAGRSTGRTGHSRG